MTGIIGQQTKTVTGTAMYRERMALPVHAVFEATLEEASGTSSPIVIGRTRLDKPGQPPFRFSIVYDPARVNENHSYAIRARITVNDRLMFTTDQPYPVLTKGHGNQAAMMMMRRVESSPGAQTGGTQAAPRVVRRGMFRYMADAANFTDCESRQRWPVAMEGAYKELEAAYLKTRRQGGEELLVDIEGKVAMRPDMEEGRPPVPAVVIDRFLGIFPGETCGASGASSPLQETYWRLTRLGDKPVILAERQREPSLVFRSRDNRVTGFGSCNNLSGSYKLNGDRIDLSRIVATRKACLPNMELEGAFFKALEQVRTWKISGEHLELYDASGRMVARFEARALK